MKDTNIHHLRLLHLLGRLALFLFLPIWIYYDFFTVIQHPIITNLDYRVIALLFTDGVLNWLQNILAFSVLSLVTPLTYSVASCSKRILVIAVSLLILGNPVTWMNIFGMLLAIIGVLCYNRAKYFARNNKSMLPSYTNSKYQKYQPLQNDITLSPSKANGINGHANGINNNHLTNGYSNLLLSTAASSSNSKLLFV